MLGFNPLVGGQGGISDLKIAAADGLFRQGLAWMQGAFQGAVVRKKGAVGTGNLVHGFSAPDAVTHCRNGLPQAQQHQQPGNDKTYWPQVGLQPHHAARHQAVNKL